MANLIPYTKSSIIKSQKSASIKADKFLNAKSTKVNANSVKPKQSKNSSEDILLKIEKKVIKIDKLLKDSFALKKKQQKKVRIKGEQKEFENREKELEKKKPKKEKGINLPTPPKMGFLDWIKNFITQTVLGFIAVRLIDFLPQLLKIFPVIIKVTDFITDIGGKLLDGLVTFVDWGYKAIDGTRSFIKKIGGEGLAKNFDKFAGAIDNIIEVAIITALATADSGVGGDLMDLGGDFIRDKLLKRGAQQVAGQAASQSAGTAAQAGGIGVGAVAGIVAGAGLLASALGEGAFQLRKIATKPIQDAKKAFDNEKNPLMKMGRGAFLGGMNALLGPLSALGVLLDVVGAPFRYAIELLRFPFLSEEDKQKQAHNLAKMDARIREDFRKALNMVTLGFAFKEKGSFGNIYGNKGAQKEIMSKMAGGGSPISAKGKMPVTRTLKEKRKSTRSLSIIPSKIKPGKSAGGEDKVQSVFPNPEKNWWDPFGVFGSKSNQQKEQQKKPTEKVSNPQEFLLESNDVLGKSNFFGPFFTLALKSVLGDKPNKLDYLKVGQGLNSWMQGVFKTGPLGFAGGGEVDAKQFFSGEDYTQVIAKSVEDSVSKEIDTTIRNLKDELSLKRPVGRDEMLQENIRRGTEEGEFESGPAGTSGDKLTMARNLMRDLGLTSAQAAGIVGNMAAESGVENARPQGSRPGTKAPLKVDGVTGYGLVQWTSKGRQQALADFARSRGADLSKPLSMDIEYQFFLKEFKGAYGNVLKQIKNATDTKTSSTIFMQQYEIPAGYKTEAKIMERYNMSKPIYDKLARGEGKATKGPGTFISPPTGKEYGSGTGGTYGKSERGTKISGDLGKYIKQNLNSPKDFSQVSEHPNYGGSFRRSYKSWHNVDRAIDIGGFWPQDQKKILPKIEEFNKKNNVKPVELLYGKPGTPSSNSHGDHVHVAYAKGGETLDGPHQALIGEKGTEYVIDADSYRATEKVAPGLFDILNYDVKDKASLIKYLPNIISSLSQYTDYENPNQEPQIVYIEVPVEVPVPIGSGGGGNIFIGGGVNKDKGMESTLAQVG